MRYLLMAVIMLFVSYNASAQLSQQDIMAKVSKGKPFTLVMLKAGTVQADTMLLARLQLDHLSHLFNLEKSGQISVFGPINNDKVFQGIIVFNTTDKDDVKKALDADPYIRAGYMSYQLYDWFSIPGQKIPE